jgi:hypothetical protein
METIKAWTIRNTSIEWNYDDPRQASPVWEKITETGRAPDTGEKLSRAYYFGPKRKPGEGPDKAWAA